MIDESDHGNRRVTGERLPDCASGLFDECRTFLLLVRRVHEEWVDDVLSAIQGPSGAEHVGIDPATMFDTVTAADLRQSLLPVTRRGAEDLGVF